MNQRREWGAVAAAVAAGAGAGFSSGRTLAMFFAQMGWASWIGVATASVAFGILCGGACLLGRRTGSDSLSGVCMRLLGIRVGRALSLLHGALLSVVGLVMLGTVGRLAELALPVRNAYWMGVLLAMGLSLLLSIRRMRGLATLGAITMAVCAVFYVGLALDPRPVRFYRRFETVAELAGSVPAAVSMGLLYAALSASVAAGAAMISAQSPGRFGVRCAVGMAVLLSSANAALMRGGERLLSMALPTVVLAARWGRVGYYGCLLTMSLSAISALTACVGGLTGARETKHDKIPC